MAPSLLLGERRVSQIVGELSEDDEGVVRAEDRGDDFKAGCHEGSKLSEVLFYLFKRNFPD